MPNPRCRTPQSLIPNAQPLVPGFLFLVIVILFISCSQPAKKERADVSDTTETVRAEVPASEEFSQFVSLLPRVSLPYALSCDECCAHPPFDHDHALVKKYVPEGANPIGLFLNDGKHVGILATYAGDMLILSAMIYDMSGKRLSDRNFMTGYCGRDYDYVNAQHLTITPEYTFVALDTAYTFKLDPATDDIIDTIEVKATRAEFFISDDGRITERGK